MKVNGLGNMSDEQIKFELQRGGKFVMYGFCISVVILSFKRVSPIFFVKAGESRLRRGLPYVGLSLLLGWWGVPWGPIWTISSVYKNLNGGTDVTEHFAKALAAPPTKPATA
jgi:hypothetical protein